MELMLSKKQLPVKKEPPKIIKKFDEKLEVEDVLNLPLTQKQIGLKDFMKQNNKFGDPPFVPIPINDVLPSFEVEFPHLFSFY